MMLGRGRGNSGGGSGLGRARSSRRRRRDDWWSGPREADVLLLLDVLGEVAQCLLVEMRVSQRSPLMRADGVCFFVCNPGRVPTDSPLRRSCAVWWWCCCCLPGLLDMAVGWWLWRGSVEVALPDGYS